MAELDRALDPCVGICIRAIESIRKWVTSHAPGLSGGQLYGLIDLDFNTGRVRLQSHTILEKRCHDREFLTATADILSLGFGGRGIRFRRGNDATMFDGGPIPTQCTAPPLPKKKKVNMGYLTI